MPDRTEVAFVTGASRGIGRLIVLHLAQAGWSVAAMARSSQELSSLPDAPTPAPIAAFEVDVRDAQAVAEAFEAASQSVGRPSVLITCAGSIGGLGPVSVVEPEEWWAAVTVDLLGTMLCARAALRWMLPASAGRIITVYGNLGDQGTANLSAFAVAKAGVARLTETLASELVGTGVTAIGMHPGFVRTSMTEHLAYSEEARRWVPGFGPRAERAWGNGEPGLALLDQVLTGHADSLAGRILFPGDDLKELTRRGEAESSLRRLRLGA